MVRADRASAGVIFTVDPESGHRGVVVITSSYGLGESVVQGRVAADQLWVHKQTLAAGHPSLFRKTLSTKEARLVYATDGARVRSEPTPNAERARFSLSDEDALTLARWAVAVEQHYGKNGEPTPMDLEWAKDGLSGELFIVQARPETVHSRKGPPTCRLHRLKEKRLPLLTGTAVGDSIRVGAPRVLLDPRQRGELAVGEILVTDTTDPDWEPVMKSAGGIVTERGPNLARGDRRPRARHPRARRRGRRARHAWRPHGRGHPLMRRGPNRRGVPGKRAVRGRGDRPAHPSPHPHRGIAQRRQPRQGDAARAVAE